MHTSRILYIDRGPYYYVVGALRCRGTEKGTPQFWDIMFIDHHAVPVLITERCCEHVFKARGFEELSGPSPLSFEVRKRDPVGDDSPLLLASLISMRLMLLHAPS